MLNVRDFETFQLAHDALPANEGGAVYVPADLYDSSSTPTKFTGLIIDRPFALIGDPGWPAGALSRLHHNKTNAKDEHAIWIKSRGRVVLRNLDIQGPGQIGQGRGVRWYAPGQGPMAGLTLDNITVHESSNLAFECICDGYANETYVSKLEMLGCSAYNSESGGSLWLGGAGTNNNIIERCEFDGPATGGFHVLICEVDGSSTVTGSFSTVEVGDEVSGVYIKVDTTVQSKTSTTLTLSKTTIDPGDDPAQVPLVFYRPLTVGTDQTPRGHVHLQRTSITRFSHCNFQGPGEQPALTSVLVSNDLELRDCYRENLGNADPPVHSFIIDDMYNLLIDGMYHMFTNGSKLLKGGLSGIQMGRVTNVQLVTREPIVRPNIVELTSQRDSVTIDHSKEQDYISGKLRDLAVSGSGVVIPAVLSQMVPGIASVGIRGASAILPGTSSTPGVFGTALATAVGTVSHPAPTSSTLALSTRRIQILTPPAASQTAALFENQKHYWRGNAAGLGGFYISIRAFLMLHSSDLLHFGFMGLRGSTSSPGNVEPGDLQDILALGVDPGDTNYAVFHRGTGSGSKVNTGMGVGNFVQFELFAYPNASEVYFRVTRLDNGETKSGVLTSNLPDAATFLAFQIHGNTGDDDTTSAIVNLVRFYGESPT